MKVRSYVLHTIFLLLPLALLLPFPFIRYVVTALIILAAAGRLYTRLIRTNLESFRFNPGTRLFHGEEGYVDIHVNNRSLLPAPFLLLEDKPDFFLNYFGRQLFLFSLRGKESRRIRYKLRGQQRGQFMLRDWTISATDIFGMSAWTRIFSDNTVITVFPRIFTIQNFFRSYRQPFGELKNKYPIFEEMSRPMGVRKYQPGDSQRRINWKLSAKTDSLMVNEYTPSISQNTLLLLNLHHPDYDFRFSEFYFELALEITASIAKHLNDAKQQIGLLCCGLYKELSIEDNEPVSSEEVRTILHSPAGGDRQFVAILETLARLHAQDSAKFPDIFSTMESISSTSTALLVITPDISLELTEQLLAMKTMGYEVHVFVFGPGIQKSYAVGVHGVSVYYIKRDESMLIVEPLHE